jgi:flagellar basal-body rod modification protein FlgD
MADNAIPTSNIWPNYSAMNKPVASGGTDGTMGKNEFLKILVAQIQNQNPMEPLQNTEFIAQMAQFSSLEQMMNIADAMNNLSNSLGLYSSMIGKQIGWQTVKDDGTVEVKTGIVDAIVVSDGKLHVVSGDRKIPIEDIISVTSGNGSSPDDEGEGVDE